MAKIAAQFKSIWCVVVAVETPPGERLVPIACAAMDLAAGTAVQVEMPQLRGACRPPYSTGPHTLVVTIDAQVLAGFHMALGWRTPERIIDLMVECHNARRPGRPSVGALAGVLAAAGQPAMDGLIAGSSQRQLRRQLDSVSRLFGAVSESLDLGRGLLRGRYLVAVACIEAVGVPVDRDLIATLRRDWPGLIESVIATVDEGFGVYKGRRLDERAFSDMLTRRRIDWPRNAAGALALDDATFREMTSLHPALSPLKDLRTTLVGFDPSALVVGRDGRNRVPLRPFASKTGRNQPSTKASVLCGAAWVRHLIRPAPGTGIAMLDWQQQEYGIAAALSADEAMQAAYRSGDPYMALAIAARAAPAGSTAASHALVRERFKRCALGVQYGMGAARLARQLGISQVEAARLIEDHKRAYPRFWRWSDDVEMHAVLQRELHSVFGWRLPVGTESTSRSIRNYPMQANGAEMLRLACCLLTEAGIAVCAPNHDAIMIEAPLSCLDETIEVARRLMAEASAVILDGFTLRTSVRVVRAPDHWSEPKGQAMWSAMKAALARSPAHTRDATCAPVSPRSIS